MNAINTTATLASDGMLHVPIPNAKPGEEYDVTVEPKVAPPVEAVDANGWPIGFLDKMYGCITDDTFVAHYRGMPREGNI